MLKKTESEFSHRPKHKYTRPRCQIHGVNFDPRSIIGFSRLGVNQVGLWFCRITRNVDESLFQAERKVGTFFKVNYKAVLAYRIAVSFWKPFK